MPFDKGENHNSDGKTRMQRDLDDLQDELAGRETGRPTRFFTHESDGDTSKGKERQRIERERFYSTLHRLLSDPVYAARYEAFDKKLRSAEEASVATLMILTGRIEAAGQALDDMRERADTLPDGTRVYRTADGNEAYTEDGRLLSDEEMQSVAWSDGAPTWEQYEAQRERLERLEEAKREVLEYQRDVLDPARERMNDENNPPSLEEIDDMSRKVDEAAPDAVKAYQQDGENFELEPAETMSEPSPEAAENLDLPLIPSGAPVKPGG